MFIQIDLETLIRQHKDLKRKLVAVNGLGATSLFYACPKMTAEIERMD